MEELQKRHGQEQRDLQSRITQKKRNATKKTRKGVNDDCAELERQLKEQQEIELAAFSGDTRNVNVGSHEVMQPSHTDTLLHELEVPNGASEHEGITNGTLSGIPSPSSIPAAEAQTQTKKPNRQKARLARRAAEQEQAAAAAAEEASSMPDRRAEEREVMKKQLRARGLVEEEVRSDGHCMYAALADQLQQNEMKTISGSIPNYSAVRADAAVYIETHADDFAPFLEEPLDEYVTKVRDTGEWGGQLELSALSKVYGLVIHVLQGDGRVEKIEPQNSPTTFPKEAWLAYYRHSFGLGAHYNSLRKTP